MTAFILELGDSESHHAFDALPDMARGYIEAAFFTGVQCLTLDPDGETDCADGETYRQGELDGVGFGNLDVESRAAMVADSLRFWISNATDIAAAVAHGGASGDYDLEQAGRDLWFTRNGHGVGYWDRGLGEIGDRLSGAARAYGETDLWAEPLPDADRADLESLDPDAFRVGYSDRVEPLNRIERAALVFALLGVRAPDPLPDVPGAYGAPMGRPVAGAGIDGETLTARRVTLDSGGYDAGGAYWGLGDPLWRLVTLEGETVAYRRGVTRGAAIANLRVEHPGIFAT